MSSQDARDMPKSTYEKDQQAISNESLALDIEQALKSLWKALSGGKN